MTQYAPVRTRLQEIREEIVTYRLQGNAATSVGARMEMWQFAASLFIERPWIGWTQKGYDNERIRQINQGQIHAFIHEFNHPHNDYLDAAAKRGVFGLGVLLACHLACLVYFWRAVRHNESHPEIRALVAVGLLIPLLFASFGLTDTHITSNRSVVMYFYLAAFIMALVENLPGKSRITDSTAFIS